MKFLFILKADTELQKEGKRKQISQMLLQAPNTWNTHYCSQYVNVQLQNLNKREHTFYIKKLICSLQLQQVIAEPLLDSLVL